MTPLKWMVSSAVQPANTEALKFVKVSGNVTSFNRLALANAL